MELARLEKYKNQYKYFDKQIDSLQRYLSNIDRTNSGQSTVTIIQPHSVSKALNVSEFDAIFLLSLAENENLVHRKFFVFTKNGNNPLGEYDNSNAIPAYIRDDETGREVYKDNYYVDIVFEKA